MQVAILLVNCKNNKWFLLFFILYICWEWWLNNPNNVLLSKRTRKILSQLSIMWNKWHECVPFFAQQPELDAEGYTYTIKQRQEKYQPPYYIITKLTPMFQRSNYLRIDHTINWCEEQLFMWLGYWCMLLLLAYMQNASDFQHKVTKRNEQNKISKNFVRKKQWNAVFL